MACSICTKQANVQGRGVWKAQRITIVGSQPQIKFSIDLDGDKPEKKKTEGPAPTQPTHTRGALHRTSAVELALLGRALSLVEVLVAHL